jgi:hypothetical protein
MFSEWEPVRLWIPRRTVSGRWVWGRGVYRRRELVFGFHIEYRWRYGDLFDTIENAK